MSCTHPLLPFSFQSQLPARKMGALAVLNSMRQHSDILVEQALLVSQELIRVAILWHEMWHEALEEASRLYFGDHNVQSMLKTLAPLHQMMEKVSFLFFCFCFLFLFFFFLYIYIHIHDFYFCFSFWI